MVTEISRRAASGKEGFIRITCGLFFPSLSLTCPQCITQWLQCHSWSSPSALPFFATWSSSWPSVPVTSAFLPLESSSPSPHPWTVGIPSLCSIHRWGSLLWFWLLSPGWFSLLLASTQICFRGSRPMYKMLTRHPYLLVLWDPLPWHACLPLIKRASSLVFLVAANCTTIHTQAWRPQNGPWFLSFPRTGHHSFLSLLPEPVSVCLLLLMSTAITLDSAAIICQLGHCLIWLTFHAIDLCCLLALLFPHFSSPTPCSEHVELHSVPSLSCSHICLWPLHRWSPLPRTHLHPSCHSPFPMLLPSFII